MVLIKNTAALRIWLETRRKKGNTIGFVPTMGALHAGHISLVGISKKDNPVTVCSIFVNPTQFNDPKDFEKYPVTLEKDIALLEAAGTELLFLPSVHEIYPGGVKPRMHYDIGYLETVLEGKFRHGHFQGVCMAVHPLLDIVQPDHLYLGQKDYQQCLVITKLIALINKDKEIKVHICPTLREADGLAMSSRNMRLKEEERKKAITIYNALLMIKENFQAMDLPELKQKAWSMLENAGFRVDYVEIADATNLTLVNAWDRKQKLVAVVAAFMNEVRLIDNMVI
ncbi:MAG: pantoate--beta-alanine ligase [Ferruginibacter sp.]|nr:pantoate--beta-alanine ligase [Chitinophagaceae bacterium]